MEQLEAIISILVLMFVTISVVLRFTSNNPMGQTLLAGSLVGLHSYQLVFYEYSFFTVLALVCWVAVVFLDGRRWLKQ